MSLKSKVVTGVAWVAGANFLGQIVTWTITIAVMRLLSPADYGLLAMASVFVAFLSMMAAAGLGPAIVQAIAIDEQKLRQLLGLITALNALLCLLLFSFAPMIASFFNELRLEKIVQVLSLQFVISGFAVVPESMLSRALNFKVRAIVDLVSNVAGGAITLILASNGYGAWSLVAGSMLTVSTRTIGLNLAAPFLRWPDFNFRGIGSLVAFGGNVTAARILWFFYSQADMFIVGKLLGKETLGFYSVAMHLASLPVQKISGVLNQVAYPAFAHIQRDPTLISAHFLKAMRILSFFAFPVLWGISSVAPDLIRLALGAKWEPAILPMQVLPAIMPLRMMSSFLPSAVDAVGRPDISVKYLISACIVMPTAFLVGSRWGLQGMCIAWVVGYPIVLSGYFFNALPAIGLRIGDLFGVMAKPAFSAICMYACVVLASVMLPTQLTEIERLPILILIGVSIYGLLTITINRDGYKLVINTVRR
jgi:teichuronic acid exporter